MYDYDPTRLVANAVGASVETFSITPITRAVMASGSSRARVPEVNENDARVLWFWAVHNCANWLRRGLDRAAARAELERFNEVSTVGYLFGISKGRVTLAAKPDHLDHLERDAQGGRRSEFYLRFLQDVVDAWLPALETTVCISMCDGVAQHPDLPTFCFQKTDGMSQILAPDFEFQWKEFYEGDEWADPYRHEDKTDIAAFFGATTGGLITEAVARALSTPRLDAARFFHPDPDVRFELPLVVQCESEAVQAMITSQPFCNGNPVAWRDQLQYRYLISIDGNGATWSRVMLALMSNSLLLKYRSPWKLYYYDFLKPNVHYLDIERHEDVQDVIRIARHWPGLFAPAVEAGQNFVERFLSRAGVQFYMAALLSLYDNAILTPEGGGSARSLEAIFDDLIRAPAGPR